MISLNLQLRSVVEMPNDAALATPKPVALEEYQQKVP